MLLFGSETQLLWPRAEQGAMLGPGDLKPNTHTHTERAKGYNLWGL